MGEGQKTRTTNTNTKSAVRSGWSARWPPSQQMLQDWKWKNVGKTLWSQLTQTCSAMQSQRAKQIKPHSERRERGQNEEHLKTSACDLILHEDHFFKELVHLKMNNLSSITHSHVVLNQFWLGSSLIVIIIYIKMVKMFEKNIKWFNKKTNKKKTHFLYMTKRFGKKSNLKGSFKRLNMLCKMQQ